jgi:cytochrome c-type biogenesis protein CcmE
MNRNHRRRLLGVVLVTGGLGVAALLAGMAFKKNIQLFFTPADVAAGKAPEQGVFRMGGYVTPGTLQRKGLEASFDVAANGHALRVSYRGLLPDLFKEGQGVVVKGRLDGRGGFLADEVLARHDENYEPPEVRHLSPDAGPLATASTP